LAARQLIWVRKRNLPNFRTRSLVERGYPFRGWI
jgi:hypothetical protein